MSGDPFDTAPCGFLTTRLDGLIVAVNATLAEWLGYERSAVVGRRFVELLTAGGKLYHETHYAPMLRMHGRAGEIAFELVTVGGERLPVLVTAVVVEAEVRVTVFDARERRAYERELLRARREAERDRERLQRLNATLQQTLLPPALPAVDGMSVAAHYRFGSADEIGGDFYDLFPLGADQWGFFLGDVVGKGALAAVLTSLVRYALRSAAVCLDSPVAVLHNLNSVLLQENHRGTARFCTVCFGVLSRESDGFRVAIASGGHPPAMLVRAGGEVLPLSTRGGQLVGVLPKPTFREVSAVLSGGDSLVFYTDGLTEARRGGDELGEERLAAFLGSAAGLDASGVVAELGELLGSWSDGPADDTAILVFTVSDERDVAELEGRQG